MLTAWKIASSCLQVQGRLQRQDIVLPNGTVHVLQGLKVRIAVTLVDVASDDVLVELVSEHIQRHESASDSPQSGGDIQAGPVKAAGTPDVAFVALA